jgi:hypothetical protein
MWSAVVTDNKARREFAGLEIKPVYTPKDLVKAGFGTEQHIYKMLKDHRIPHDRLGDKITIPGTWVHGRIGLTDA